MVRARVISVPSTLFDDADMQPCNIDAQNEAAESLRALIQAQLNGEPIEYVQLMGSFDILPPFYTPDDTSTGFEGLFASDLLIQPNTPLAVGIAEGNNITDAPYTDRVAQPFRGRSLYIEDLPIARMVEHPDDMLEAATRFVASNGQIDVTRIFTSGYDFFKDGTAATNLELGALPAPLDTLNNDFWTADELRCGFLGEGPGCNTPPLGVVNAHYSYNALLTAAGFLSGDPSEVVGSIESFEKLTGLILSIGCHSALTVPDAWALPLDLPISTARDWAQEQGGWLGSYTFAYGDTVVADRGTEGIITLIARELVAGATVGRALVDSKQRYALRQFEFTEYDEKSMIALTALTMPQYRLAQTATSSPNPPGAGSDGALDLTLIEEGASSTVTLGYNNNSNDLGTWYDLNGTAHSVFSRPLLPLYRAFEQRPRGDGTLAHGVLVRGGKYHDRLDVDPVFSAMSHDLISTIDEPEACARSLVPSRLGSLSTFDTAADTLQSLNVHTAQFRCAAEPGEPAPSPVTGTLRLYDDLTLELTHPLQPEQDSDFQPPVVTQQDIQRGANDVVVTLNASDNLGIREIVVLIYMDLDGAPGGDGMVSSVSSGNLVGTTGPWQINLPGAGNRPLAFQYVDLAGNITVKTLKGGLYRPDTGIDCTDPLNDVVFANADIGNCSIQTDGTAFSMDVDFRAAVRSDVRYRLRLIGPEGRRRIEYEAGSVSAAGFLNATVTETGSNSLRIEADAGAPQIGWTGSNLLQLRLETFRQLPSECFTPAEVSPAEVSPAEVSPADVAPPECEYEYCECEGAPEYRRVDVGPQTAVP